MFRKKPLDEVIIEDAGVEKIPLVSLLSNCTFPRHLLYETNEKESFKNVLVTVKNEFTSVFFLIFFYELYFFMCTGKFVSY